MAPGEALDEVTAVAEIWGADFERGERGGSLLLPVSAGLRHGVVRCGVSVEPTDKGTVLTLAVEEERFQLRLGAVAILVLGALGGLSLALWPVFPPLLQFAPVGLILTTVAWLLVVSRLRSTGAEDFLALVAPEPEEPPPPEPDVEEPPAELRPR